MVLAVGDISHDSQTCILLSLRDNGDEVVRPANGCGQIESGCGQKESQIKSLGRMSKKRLPPTLLLSSGLQI